MLEDLTWDNYLKLNDYLINEKYKKEYFTPVVIIQWQFYGLFFKFRKIEDAVIMYLRNENNYPLLNLEDTWVVYASYYKQTTNINNLKNIIKQDLRELNGSNTKIVYFDFLKETFNDWNLPTENLIESKYISNYIYDLEKMKTFSGKKLQKKRNHLNAFIKDNHNYQIKEIKDVDPQVLVDFSAYHIKKYAESFRQYEVDVYKKYLFDEMQKDSRYKGCVIYIDNKIVGFTLGFVNNDTYEVIIEKAEREIRGLYQFLISENLKLNNINVQYMDREDDAGIDELAKSKMSYYPIAAIKRYSLVSNE